LPTPLTSNSVGLGSPTFSPDGTRIAFAKFQNNNQDIYLINADGSNERRLTSHFGEDLLPRFGATP